MREQPLLHFSTKSRVIALLSFLFLLDGLALWFAAHLDYQNTLNRAHLILQKTAQSLEARMERTIVGSDLILRHIAESMQGRGIEETVFSREEWERFRREAEGLPDVGSLWLLDNDGNLVMDSTEYPSKHLNFSAREYFKPQRDKAIESYVGPIVKGKITNKYSFTISRRISGEDGAFLGIVVAAIETDDFTNFLRNLSIGENASLAVFRIDGALIFRQPMGDEYLERNFKHLKLFSMPFDDSPSGLFETEDSLDRIERLVAYQKMQRLPLVAVTTVPVASIGQEWRARVKNYSIIAILALFVLAGLSWLVLRSVSREVSLRSELEERVKERTAELAAARNEAISEKSRLEAVMEALPTGVAITDLAGGNIQSNAAFRQVWGGPRPPADSVDDYAAYKAWWADTGRAVVPEEWASARAVKCGEAVVGQLLEIERFDGSRASVINSASPVRDAQGNVIGCAVAIQDISDLRKAEQALRESEERFRLFMDNSPTIAWIKDEQGRYVYFNKTERTDLASDWRTGSGKTDFEVWPKETAAEFRKNDQAVLAAGHAIEVTEETVNPDGSLCYWLNSKFPFRDLSGRQYVAGIGLDITERKRMEDVIRHARDELEIRVQERTGELLRANEVLQEQANLLDLAHDAILVRDLHDRVVYWNRGAEKTYGWTQDEARGKVADDLLQTRFSGTVGGN